MLKALRTALSISFIPTLLEYSIHSHFPISINSPKIHERSIPIYNPELWGIPVLAFKAHNCILRCFLVVN